MVFWGNKVHLNKKISIKYYKLTYIVPVYENETQIVGVLCADSSLKPYTDLMRKSISGGNLYITDFKDFYGIQKNSRYPLMRKE